MTDDALLRRSGDMLHIVRASDASKLTLFCGRMVTRNRRSKCEPLKPKQTWCYECLMAYGCKGGIK